MLGWCMIEDAPKPPSRRITLTLPVLTHVNHVVFAAMEDGGGGEGDPEKGV